MLAFTMSKLRLSFSMQPTSMLKTTHLELKSNKVSTIIKIIMPPKFKKKFR